MLTSCPVHASFKKRKPAHPLPFAVIDTIHHYWSSQYKKNSFTKVNTSARTTLFTSAVDLRSLPHLKTQKKILQKKPGIKIKKAFPIHLLSL
jgi:hypothetical protein